MEAQRAMEFRIRELEKDTGYITVFCSSFLTLVHTGITWGSLNNTYVAPTLSHSDLIGLACNLGIRIFKSSSGDSQVQQTSGTTGFMLKFTDVDNEAENLEGSCLNLQNLQIDSL